MVRTLALMSLTALSLLGCRTPFVAMSPEHDQRWAQQRRLCAASPQMAHCDVYLRNELPPAPYTTDGMLVEQRQRCFETRNVADCSLAQQMGRQADAEATGRISPIAATTSSRQPRAGAVEQEQVFEQSDGDGLPSPRAAADLPANIAAEALPAPAEPRPRRRGVADETAAPCSPAVLESLDMVDGPARAAILRRCVPSQR
jgi:hypothetical protein